MKKSLCTRSVAACLLGLSALISACGGGGGSTATTGPGITPSPTPATPAPNPDPADPFQPAPAPGAAPASYTINGSISVLETAAVDSDINDVNATYLSNDSAVLAQTLNNPVLLTGHLTFQGQGPAGPNRTNGDLIDIYRVRLSAGQTIELDFAADPATIDIDLFAYDAGTGDLVGQSSGVRRYECLRVVRDGDYYLSAEIFQPGSSGDSVYQLRISAPDSPSGNCAEATNNVAAIIPGEIVARAAAGVTAGDKSVAAAATKATAAALGMGLRVAAGDPGSGRMALFGLPVGAAQRATLMARLGAAGAGTPVAAAKAAGTSLAYASLGNGVLPAASRDTLETIAQAKAMSKSGLFAYAFPNLRLRATQALPLVGTLPSNDRDYASQRWHYDMISLPLAMQTLAALSPQPTQRPVVAVVDTGIVSDHDDLAGNIVGGYDFVASASTSGDGNGIDANPDDSSRAATNPSFHGSHVAGTVGAQGFNGIGGLGVAPMAQIMPLRVLGEGGTGSFYDIMQGVMFAARLPNDSGTLPPRRADVINLSLGGGGACPAQIAQIFAEVRAQGSVIVAASGNESSESALTPVGVPANCPGVLAVGAVDAQRGRAFYSNGGPELAVVAPGGDVRRSTTGNGAPDGVYSTIAAFQGGVRRPSYTHLMGTSMATPHVAGMVALMRWVNPGLTVAAIESLIRGGSISEDLGAAGRDNLFGSGLLNAKRAVDAAVATLGGGGTPPVTSPGQVEATPLDISLGATRSEAELLLQRVGETTETVTSVRSGAAAVVITASSVDASGLGVYRVSANRAALTEGQVAFVPVVITTSTPRTITVSVGVERRSTARSGSFGPIYVLALNGDSGELESVAQATSISPVGGRYAYSLRVNSVPGRPAPQRIYVIAGSDLDNDQAICNSGEACGAYPFLNSRLEAVEPRAAVVSGVDFDVSPFGGINPSALTALVPLGVAGQRFGFAIGKPQPASAAVK